MVTVVGESGKPFTFEASEEVKNLPQLKAGDIVTVDYYDSVAIWVAKPVRQKKARRQRLRGDGEGEARREAAAWPRLT